MTDAGGPDMAPSDEADVSETEAAERSGFTVRLARTGKDVFVPDGGSILFSLLEADVQVPYACGAGVCGACWQNVVEGEPEHHDFCLSDEQRDNGAVMICCAGSRSSKLTLDL